MEYTLPARYYIGKNTVYVGLSLSWFQVSTGGLGMYSPRISGGLLYKINYVPALLQALPINLPNNPWGEHDSHCTDENRLRSSSLSMDTQLGVVGLGFRPRPPTAEGSLPTMTADWNGPGIWAAILLKGHRPQSERGQDVNLCSLSQPQCPGASQCTLRAT